MASGWRALGWFGIALAVVGFADVALLWYPSAIGNAQWEFGTIGATISSLPLLTMGLAGIFASGFALRSRWKLQGAAIFAIALALALLGAYALYLLSVPVVLASAPPQAEIELYKAVAKTTLMAITFPVLYLAASVAALRFPPEPGAKA